MQLKFIETRFTSSVVLSVCFVLLLAGCDKRKYNSTVYKTESIAGDTLLADPTNAAGGPGNGTSGGAGVDTGGGAGDGSGAVAGGGAVEGGGAGGGVGTGGGAGESGGAGVGNGGGAGAGDEAGDGNSGVEVDGDPLTVGSSNALEGAVTGKDAEGEPIAVEPAVDEGSTTGNQLGEVGEVGEVGEAGEAGEAGDADASEPLALPAKIPPAVPQGPDVDRIGSSSIYQPFADVETATLTIDGRRSLALAAVGGPVLQSPRALMEEIEEYFLNDANQVAYTGRFSVARQNSYGVWTGDAGNPVQIFQTGTAIPGLPDGQTYFKTLKLSLGEDGSLSQIIEVQNEDTLTQAYLVSRGARHEVLMQTATSIPGLIGSVGIDAIEHADQSGAASALVSSERMVSFMPAEQPAGNTAGSDEEIELEDVEVITEQYSIWYLASGKPTAIAHSWIDSPQRAPALANGCRLYAPANVVDNLRLGVTNNGQLVFQAQIGGDGRCDSGRAVIRYDGTTYQEVVKNGDPVPGAMSHIFNDVSLYTVTEDGSAVVFANLITPEALEEAKAAEEEEEDLEANRLAELLGVDDEEEEIDDGLWSFWIMPPRGGARLVAMEGEEVQIGRTLSVLSGETRSLSMQINESNQVALKLLLDDAEQAVFFVGVGHAGQPHTSFESPGASALRYAFTSNSALPGQNSDAVLDSLGTPYVNAQGELVIYGEVGPSDESIQAAEEAETESTGTSAAGTSGVELVKPFNSIFQIDAQGAMREIVRSGDKVAVAGVNKALSSLSDPGQIARPGTSGIRVNSAGAMLLRATIERKFGNPVLLYIAP